MIVSKVMDMMEAMEAMEAMVETEVIVEILKYFARWKISIF